MRDAINREHQLSGIGNEQKFILFLIGYSGLHQLSEILNNLFL